MAAIYTNAAQTSPAQRMQRAIEKQDWQGIFSRATQLRSLINGSDAVHHINSRTIAYTNVCTIGCSFCSFYRSPTQRSAYVMNVEEAVNFAIQAVQQGAVRIVIQGGVNPECSLAYYTEMIEAITQALPDIQIDAFSPREIYGMARHHGSTIESILQKLYAAGLRGVTGSGNELSPDQISTGWRDWSHVMQVAQQMHYRTSATLVWGFGESWQQRLQRMDELQEMHTHALAKGEPGFAFLMLWPVQQHNRMATYNEIAQVIAVARNMFPTLPHIAAPYLPDSALAQVAIAAGADLLVH